NSVNHPLSSGHVVNVESTGLEKTTVRGGNFDDHFHVGTSSQGLADIKGELFVQGFDGSDTLVVNDNAGTQNNRQFTLTSDSLPWDGGTTIHYSSVEALTLQAGPGDDTLDVQSLAVGTPVSFRGNDGSDTLAGPDADNTFDITNNDHGILSVRD